MYRYATLVLVGFALGCPQPPPQAGDSCSTIRDCIGEQRLACQGNRCAVVPCARSAECPLGAACVDAVCGEAECEADDDCPTGFQCFEGDCRNDLCEFKAECGADQVCIGSPPRCSAPPLRCANDRECPSDLSCKLPDGVCDRRCTSDSSCPDQSYCDGDFCRLACRDTSECADGEVCLGERCITNTCGEVACPTDRPFLDPTDCSCVGCLSDVDCRVERNERCNDVGACVYCPVRAATAGACLQQQLVLDQGCCMQCVDERDCAEASVCTMGRCEFADPRDCARDDDCPIGWRCDLGVCVEEGSSGACAVQADCPDGEACYLGGECRPEAIVCDGCSEPNRCVAEPQDDEGTCAGCDETCATQGCPAGEVCYVPPGAAEGFCAPLGSVGSCP